MYIYTQTHTRVLSDREQNFSNRVRKSFPREIGAARRGAFQLLKITEIKLSSFEMYDRRGVCAKRDTCCD